MWKLLKNQNGMTLMEVVVGIAIIGIASVMLVTGFGFIGRMLQHSNSVKMPAMIYQQCWKIKFRDRWFR